MRLSILKHTETYHTMFYLMSVTADKYITAIFVKMSSRIFTHIKRQLNYQSDQKDYFTK